MAWDFRTKSSVHQEGNGLINTEFDSKVPDTFEGLVKPRSSQDGLIVLNVAFDKCVGVSIDTHLHRMLQQLNWVRRNSKNPEQTRKDLESWLHICWNSMNLTWVVSVRKPSFEN